MARAFLFLLLLVLAVPGPAQPTIKLEAHGGRFVSLADEAMGYFPEADPNGAPPPVLIVLHGAGGNAATALAPVVGEASKRGIAVVAVKSRKATWDAVGAQRGGEVGGFSGGAARLPSGDRKRIEQALEALSAAGPIDRERLALFGFSDGASMALSLGAARPDDYPHVIAFAPGGMLPGKSGEAQRVLIAHGTADGIIPYGHGAGRVCPAVARSGRDVRFLTFEGGHQVEARALGAALDAFLDPSRPAGEPGCP